ncbi:MAG: hypothetical protein C4343_06050 [Chloroflexota bacterium]
MPRLACWSCGRTVYTVSPIEALFAEERRCPRCGALMNADRREGERRQTIRRQNPPDDPGPPDGIECRVTERRVGQRRGGDPPGARSTRRPGDGRVG